MTEKLLLNRIENLKKDRLYHEKMCISIDGALQDCEYWLSEIYREECDRDEPQ